MGCGAGTARTKRPARCDGKAAAAAGSNHKPSADPPTSSGSQTRGETPKSTATPSVALDAAALLEPVSAERVETEELRRRLQHYVQEGHPRADLFRQTLDDIASVLATGVGGVIVAVVDEDLVKDLSFSYLDTGLLTKLCHHCCGNILAQSARFEALLRCFSSHSDTDRWSQTELEALARELPEDAAPFLVPLESNPKDGAFVVLHDGTIVAAAGHLRYSSELYQLQRADGNSCGTRHAAALALTEWMGRSDHLGAVFVRSDGGGVHGMLPQRSGEPPLVMHFDSSRHLTQPEMMQLFKERIMKHGKLMHKVQPAMIRPGIRGECVVTCVNGRVISEVSITDDTSKVIRATTESKELYVLSREKFDRNWEPIGQELTDSSFSAYTEFKLHKPKPGIQKWIYKCTAEDIALVPTGCFEAAWGAVQPLRKGDFLAMPAPEDRATEIYLMDMECVSSYCISVPGKDVRCDTPTHRSQSEMLSLFKERIMRRGRLMRKVQACQSRPGRMGERVVTCVTGRIISDVTVPDATSMVVRAPTMYQELYVLSERKFFQNWMPEAEELDQSNPVNRLLAAQGFKSYAPRPNLKWTYTVTDADMELVPTGWFYGSWGALQPIQAGDYLAMPAPEDRANEVYLMPMETLTCYEEVKDSTGPLEAPDRSDCASCSQEEMLRLFGERIRAQGRLVVKSRPGLLRPGRCGDRVVTYVSGRVTSDVVIDDHASMVVRAPTVDHEEYVLPQSKFLANWEPDGEPLDLQNPELAPLHARGFRLHRPRPNKKFVYKVQASDLDLVPPQGFIAAWGALQTVQDGDYLAMPADLEHPPEVYLMPQEVLESYEDFAEVLQDGHATAAAGEAP